MTLYKLRNLQGAETTNPPIEALAAGELAKRDRVLSVLGQQDRLLGNGRRVICRVGLNASEKFGVGSDDPDSGAGQIYPLLTVQRKAARAKVRLTPGHLLMFSALVVPSGMTQKLQLETGWFADTPYGRIDVRVEFDGAVTDTVVFSVPLPVSQEQFAGETTTPGAAWSSLRRVEIPLIWPDNVTTNLGDLHNFSDDVTADISIEYVGGVRCVDAVVQERPFQYLRDLDSDSDFAMPIATDGAGESVKIYPVEYPIEERSSTDPSYGALLLADVAHRQQNDIGPIAAQWTSWDDASQSPDSLEADAVTTSSTTFVNLLDASLTAWSDTYPGWSASSGGNAQQFRSSNPLRETRDKDACMACHVWVYGHRTVTGTATVRVQTEDHSVAELTIDSSTPQWWSALAHLRCGLGAEQESAVNLLGKVSSGSAALHVQALVIEYLDV